MSIFRYNVFILDPENRLIDHNGEVRYGEGVIYNDCCIDISLIDSEIIIHLVNANTHRRFFLSKCARPDDWREVDDRLLYRCCLCSNTLFAIAVRLERTKPFLSSAIKG